MVRDLTCAWAVLAVSSVPAWSQVTFRASVDSAGQAANCWNVRAAVDDFGDVLFESCASNLVPGDTNGFNDVFFHSRTAWTTERVNVSSSGAEANAGASYPSLSADGRFVVFSSFASNLVAGDTNGHADIFVRDRSAGTTERVSLSSAGAEGDDDANTTAISPDGRWVAFTSFATNFAPVSGGFVQLFLHDRQSGTTELLSVSPSGACADGDSEVDPGAFSTNGRWLTFWSSGTNLVPGDTNGFADVFVRDLWSGTTELVSVDPAGGPGDADSYYQTISGDGRFVAFHSLATNLVAGDANGWSDIFLRDRTSGVTELVSVSSSLAQGDLDSVGVPCVSADGRYVAFFGGADNLVVPDLNNDMDIFVRDRLAGTTEFASVNSYGSQGDDLSQEVSMSSDGRFVAFTSLSRNLVPGDTYGSLDVFVHDRSPLAPGLDLCVPGGDASACPCANPPSGLARGCDNSAHTGGARLTSLGTALVSSDTLRLLGDGLRPGATCVVIQGSARIGSGVTFGQGVNCVGGTLHRMYVKPAIAGSIYVPEGSEPNVALRSSILGDPIGSGSSRWYALVYRDPNVPAACSPLSTFNISQAQEITWGP